MSGSHETFTLGKATPTVATTPSVGATSASDSVIVGGTVGTPSGTVDFKLYTSGNVQVGTTDTETLSGGAASTTEIFNGLTPGASYYFVATYNGDGTYLTLSGSHETFTLSPPPPPPSPLTPTVVTIVSVTGVSATDSATVTGTSGTPTGTVTFNLYFGSCSTGTQVAGYSDSETLVNGSATTQNSTGSLAAGNYYFIATYGGNGTYTRATGQCEPFTVIVSSPPAVAIVTTAVVVSGTSASDTATVSGPSGLPAPTGTVTFTLFFGACLTGTQVAGYSDTEILTSGGATSVSTGSLKAGSYYFIGTYSGGGTYSSVTGDCEPFTIAPTVPPYVIPSKAPQTGAGGTANAGDAGTVLVLSGIMLLAGLALMGILERRRRRA